MLPSSSSSSKTETICPKLYSRASQAPGGVGTSVSKTLSSECPLATVSALQKQVAGRKVAGGFLQEHSLPGSHAQNTKGMGVGMGVGELVLVAILCDCYYA